MNKKGFTLMELVISLTLLSLVLLFAMKFVSNVKAKESKVSYESDLLLNKNITSKVINDYVIEKDGISSLDWSDYSATITLKDNSTINLSISNKVLTFGNTILKRNMYEDYKISCETGTYTNTLTISYGTSEYDIIVSSLK